MARVSPEATAEPPAADGNFIQRMWREHKEHAELMTSYWEPLCRAVEANEVKERLKMQWTNLALVSALLVTLSIPYMIEPAIGGRDADPEERESALVQAHIVLISVSGILSVCIVFVCSFMLAEIDLCSSDEEIIEFLNMFSFPQEVIWLLFYLSIYTLIAAILMALHYQTTAAAAWTVIGTTVFLLGVSWTINFSVDKWVKLRLAKLKTRSASMRRDAAAAQTLESAEARVTLGSDEASPLNKK